MRTATRSIVAGAAVLASVALSLKPGQQTVASQIDHVMFVVPDREGLTAFLTDTLGLPLVWPLPGAATSSTSGISVGNVNLELSGDGTVTTGFLSGVFFQPANFAGLHDELEKRGVAHQEPSVWPPADTAGRRWTTLRLEGLGMYTFFVQYHGFDMNERRRTFDAVLRERGGGALGVIRAVEIRRAVSNLPEITRRWNRLAGTNSASSFRFGEGPAVRLMERSDTLATELVLEVHSTSNAMSALQRLRAGFARAGDTLRLERRRFGGLQVLLVPVAAPGSR